MNYVLNIVMDIRNIAGWWLSHTPLKNMSSSVGMMNFPIYGKKTDTNHQPVVDIRNSITLNINSEIFNISKSKTSMIKRERKI